MSYVCLLLSVVYCHGGREREGCYPAEGRQGRGYSQALTYMEGAVMSLSTLDVTALLAPYIAKQQSRIAPLRQHFDPCALTLKMSSDNESILRKSAFWVLYFPLVPYLHKHAYPWETFDGTADSSTVTSHYRSVNQGLGKLWHAWHVLLLVTVFFEHQACEQVECRKRKWCIMLLH